MAKKPQIDETKNIGEKQSAVKELVRKNDWRKKFILASTQNSVSKNDVDGFMKWLMSKNESLTFFQNFYPVIPILLLIVQPLLILFIPDIYSWLPFTFFAIFLGNLIYLHALKPQRDQLILALRNNLHLLYSYSAMIALVDNEEFESNYLIELKKQINTEAEKTLKKIGRIGRLFELVSLRGISYEPISRNFFL